MAKILIVDDNDQNRHLLEAALKGDGHEVASARNGAEALALAEKAPPDLVISDILMPVMDGYELCRRWKADTRLSRAPFILYTATYTDTKDGLFGLRLGADRFISKPAKVDVLQKIAREVLEGKSRGTSAGPERPLADAEEVLQEYGEVTSRNLLQKLRQLEEEAAARAKTEEALREKEEQYRSLVDNAPMGIVVHENGAIRFMNKFAADRIGIKDPKEYEGRNIFELIHPDDQDAIKARMARPEHEAGLPIEIRILARDGSAIDAELTSVPVAYLGKRCVMAMIQDITERREAEALVEESWLAYMTLAENLPGIFYRIHLQENNRLEFFNKKLEELTGFSEKELGPWEFSPLESLMLPEDRGKAGTRIGRSVSEHSPFTAEYRIRHKDGGVRWMEETATGICDHDRQPLCIDGVIFDITERRRAAEALKQSEERYRAMIETSNDMIWSLDEKGRFTFFNKRAEEISGRKLKDWAGRVYFPLVAEADLPHVMDVFKSTMAGRSQQYEVRIKHPDKGLLTLSVSTAPIYTEGRIAGAISFGRDITRQKQAEEELREEKSLFIAGPSVVFKWLMCEDWPVTYVSPNIREQFGYAPEDFTGGKVRYLDIIHPDDKTRALDEVRHHKEAGSPCFEQEYRIVRADGEHRWVHDFTMGVRDSAGEVLYYRGYISDITGRKRTENALRESEEKFRLFFEEAAIGMCLTAPDGRFLAVNRAMCAMLGYGKEDLLKRTFADIVHPDDAEKSGKWAARMLSGETCETSMTTRYVHRNGGMIWADVSTSLLRDQNGVPLYFITQIRNISYRKLLEDALTESETKYRTLFEKSTNAVILADAATGEILDANKSAETLTDRKREELIGMNRLKLHPSGEAKRYAKHFQNHVTAGNVISSDAVVARKDGALIPVQISATVMELNRRKVIHGVFEDISGRRRAEEEQQRLIAELTHANSEMAQFNRLIAHDLQEPLRMVVSYIQLLTKRLAGKLEPSTAEFLDFVEEGGLLMQKMVQDLMHYTRVGAKPSEWKEVDMNGVAARALAALQLPIGESKAFISCGRLPAVTANAAQMEHLFQNLIGNAIKFRSSDTPRIDLSAEEKENEYVFAVRDNGIGIPPQYAERVFNIFQRLHTRAEYPGTGVGLALCKKIVAGYGGRIWVEPAPEKGSIFRFTIPKRGGHGGGEKTGKQG